MSVILLHKKEPLQALFTDIKTRFTGQLVCNSTAQLGNVDITGRKSIVTPSHGPAASNIFIGKASHSQTLVCLLDLSKQMEINALSVRKLRV